MESRTRDPAFPHFLALHIPIHIARHTPEGGGYWYQWQALAGSGDRGTFEDALVEALTHVQRTGNLKLSSESLIASPGRHTRTSVVTLRGAYVKCSNWAAVFE